MVLLNTETIKQPKFDNIPAEMASLPQWVLWKPENSKLNAEYKKVPYQPNGQKASSTNASTWSTFATVQKKYLADPKNWGGIGLVLTSTDNLVCVDIDGINDINNVPVEYHNLTNLAWTEISTSGTGLHMWMLGKKPSNTKNKNTEKGIELYDSNRFIVVTGNIYEGSIKVNKLLPSQKLIDKIAQTYFTKNTLLEEDINITGRTNLSDLEVISLIKKQKPKSYKVYQGDFSDYFSQSDAIMALLNDLAFYTGKNTEQMESIFNKSSAVYEDPSENSRKLQYSIATAVEGTINVYNNRKKTNMPNQNSLQPSQPQGGNPVPGKQLKDWWQINLNGTKSFSHYVLAEHILQEHSIVRYPNAHSDLYFWNFKTGIYEQDKSGKLIKGLIRSKDKQNLKESHVREVYQYIETLSRVVKDTSNKYIAVGNGLINLETFKLEDFTPQQFIIQKVATNYRPAAHNEFIENTLNKVTDNYEPSLQNIKEMFACVLYPKLLVPKIFYLYGRTAHNGKSSLLNMIHKTFNYDGGKISAVAPQKLVHNTFASASMYGKMANIVDDQPDLLIEDSGALRTMLTGGTVEIERKGKDSESVEMIITMIIASNYYPNFKESGKQINRRLHIIPFDHDFSNDKDLVSDSESMRQIATESAREYVLKLAVNTLEIMLKNPKADKLTFNEKAIAAGEAFAEQNDPLSDYFAEYTKSYFEDNTGQQVIKDYEIWCSDNRVTPFGNKRFKERVCTEYNMQWKQKRIELNGRSKNVRGFVSI